MKLIILIIFLNKGVNLIAQINPSNGSILNYNQILFEYPIIENADQYLIQIVEENIDNSFNNLTLEKKDSSTVTIINNLEFGKKYLWRYTALLNGKSSNWHGPFKFSILIDSNLNINNYRTRIIKNTTKNADGVLTLDYIKLIIDRSGLPVWYLPNSKTLLNDKDVVRDLRITNEGTFTFITSTSAIECDILGNVIWIAPNNGKVSGDTTEYYHHGFKKLKNGNYMVMGNKYTWKNVPEGFDISKFRKENLEEVNGKYKLKILFGTIIEYDKNKEVIWSWNSADYFKEDEIFSTKTLTNSPRKDLPQNAELFGHLNAFEQDELGVYVYAGFRDLSRVIKINKKSRQVEFSWGEKMSSGHAIEGEGFFKHQHDIGLSSKNNLFLFNNNGINITTNSSNVVEFSQPTKKLKSQIKWSFDCKFDSLASGKSIRNGGVEFINDSAVLICLGGVNRIVEVLKSKEVVWDCFVETNKENTNYWLPVSLYRTHHKSSLYPYYFSIQNLSIDFQKNKSVVKLKIFNEGTENDCYNITILNSLGKKINVIETSTIEVGKSKLITFSLENISAFEKEIIFEIKSFNNLNLIKQQKFVFKD